jgi:hypothetical protein
MARFRKKPVVVEAVRFDGFAGDGTLACLNPWPEGWDTSGWYVGFTPATHLAIPTLEGVMQAQPGDWIIRGVKGEAARAYDAVAREAFGGFATVNFPAPGEQPARASSAPWICVALVVASLGCGPGVAEARRTPPADEPPRPALVPALESIEARLLANRIAVARWQGWRREPSSLRRTK